jgi:hypothetical protein
VKASGKSGKFHGSRRAPVVEPSEIELDFAAEGIGDPRMNINAWAAWIQMMVEIEHGAQKERRESR